MNKVFVSFVLIIIIFLSTFNLAFGRQFPNKINDTNFINGGYLFYDINSYNYNKKQDVYSVDVMEELDPGGDMADIKCPYGEGLITHVISSTKYSPTHKYFKAQYKGFLCSTGEYEYENSIPITFQYNYKGVYYDNNPSIIPDFNMDYFENLKKEINNPNEYNYFGFVKNIRNHIKSSYSIDILDKKYTCYNNNCYDFDSFEYNKLTKSYYIDMIVDLMNWNAHEEYESPYNDGYISHLLFETRLHNNKLFVKCNGFVTGDVVVDYKNGKASSAHYNIKAIHRGKPATIKNIKEFEETFYRWIDVGSVLKLLKTW